MYRFIPPLVVLTPHDSNVAVCRPFCVLYMPLFGLVQARPWFRSSNCTVASKIAGSSFLISHLAFFLSHISHFLTCISFLSRISYFLSRILHFLNLASHIFISHIAFFILHLAFFISHLAFLCRIYLQKFFSSPTKSHLECPLQASVELSLQFGNLQYNDYFSW